MKQLLTAFLLVLTLAAPAVARHREPTWTAQPGGLSLADDWSWRQDDGVCHVRGLIRNDNSATLDYVEVDVTMYDGDGNRIDDGMANTTKLGPGEVWKFDAVGLQSRGVVKVALGCHHVN